MMSTVLENSNCAVKMLVKMLVKMGGSISFLYSYSESGFKRSIALALVPVPAPPKKYCTAW